MKNLIFLFGFVFLFLSPQLNGQTGSFKVRDDALIQVGYNGVYKALTFGGNESTTWTHQNGLQGIEYWNSGFNVFVPWPAYQSGNYKLFVQNNGNVGIGKFPAHKLDVNGDIATFGTVQVTSDKRLKKNITPLNGLSSLSAVTALKTYTYQYIFDELPIEYSDELIQNADSVKLKTINADLNRKADTNTKLRTGFMAQEVMEILPNLVERDENDRYSIDYMAFIPILASAMQEQQVVIEKLENKIESLEIKLNEQKRK